MAIKTKPKPKLKPKTKPERKRVSAKRAMSIPHEDEKIDVLNPKRLMWREPITKPHDGISAWTVWESLCGRYRAIYSVSGTDKHFAASYRKIVTHHDKTQHEMWDTIELDPKLKPSYYSRQYPRLADALAAVKKFHEEKFSVEVLHTNAEETIAHALPLGLAGLSVVEPTTKRVREVTETRESAPIDPKNPSPVVNKPRVPRQNAAGVDRFNCRLGSGAATINESITETAQTADQIAVKSQVPLPRVKSHLAGMISRGFVTKVGNDKFKEGK